MLLSVYHCLFQCHEVCMSITVSQNCWLSLTLTYSAMELQTFTHCLPWLLAVFHSLSDPMKLLHVSHCLSLLLAFSHCPYQWKGVTACVSLSHMVAGCPLLSLQVRWSSWLSFTASHDCWLSRTVSLVPCSCYMSVTSWYGPRKSLTFSTSAMEFLHVSHCPLWLLSPSLSLSIVAGCLSLSLLSHGVAACLSLSLLVASCLSLFLPVPWSCNWSLIFSHCSWLSPTVVRRMPLTLSLFCWLSLTTSPDPMVYLIVSLWKLLLLAVSHSLPVSFSCCMSYTVSYFCWLSLTVSPVPWSCNISVTLSHGYWLSLTFSSSATEFLAVSHWISRLLAVFRFLFGLMELLHVFPCPSLLLAVSHGLSWSMEFMNVSCSHSLSL